MEIRLGESDSFLHDGEAKIVIVHVTLGNGKKVQFPYPANNPISEIYKAVSRISDEKINVPAVSSEALCTSEATNQSSAVSHAAPGAGDSHTSSAPIIGREDLVKCIKLYPRGDGATVDLKVGDIYRVLKIVKNGFEVIDDKSATPMRLFVFSDEVVFHQKRKPPVPKVEGKKSKSGLCPVCNVETIFYKQEDGRFTGECLSCKNTTELIDASSRDRNTIENATAGAGASVSESI